ncbi:MAG TPA: metal ABC transporter permease, partial [Phycisphaerales bacterium]|nr:metal ABC transporter permease [Phycisphaerales bacterium]
WAFDEGASAAFGVPSRTMRSMLLIVLALAIVVTMRLAGVVLATALLVLPGAAALELSDRLRPVYVIALAVGVLGVALGLVLSFEMNWQPGPSIVLALTAMFAAARACSTIRARRTTAQERPA